jgi:hypothetical protein
MIGAAAGLPVADAAELRQKLGELKIWQCDSQVRAIDGDCSLGLRCGD